MDDNLDLDLGNEEITRKDKRIESLSSKVKETSTERDEAKAKAEAAEAARLAAEKERDFYASFSDTATKFPAASEYKDKIKEKVLAGYSVEDATVAVLNAENKLVPQAAPPPPPPGPAAGGSSDTQLPSSGQKSVSEMTRDEKRAALIEAEKRGDISLT